jgi:hypothetical protein
VNEKPNFSFSASPSEFGGFLMSKERFDVAADVHDVKYRRVFYIDAIYDDVIPNGKASQPQG